MASVVTCPHFPACSGCSSIGIEYAGQLEEKVRAVQRCFEGARLAGFDPASIQSMKTSPLPAGYRNRAKLVPQRGGAHRVELGLYRLGTHEVIDIPDCPVQMAGVNRAAATVRTGLGMFGVSIYDEATHTGDLRFVTVRQGAATGELLIGFVTRADPFPQGTDLAEYVLTQCVGAVGVVQNINPTKGNVIFGRTSRVLAGRAYLEEVVCGVRLRLGMSSFFQVNTPVAQKAYEAIIKGLELCKEATLVDLYCGVGSIALAAAPHVARVIGVEELAESIELARAAAVGNGLGNVELRDGLVEELLADLAVELAGDRVAGKLLRVSVNPPRKGIDPTVGDELLKMKPGRIAYLSCEPVTLVRDLERLVQGGCALRHVELFDMFPQTQQVETLAILEPDESRDYVTIRHRGRGGAWPG